METPSLTVLVCSRFRHEKLRQFIESLERSVVPGDLALELVVVINEPPDSDIGWLERICEKAHHPIRVCREPIKGLSRARNRGVRESTGDYVFFTDDDVVLESDTLEAISRVVSAGDRPIFGGRVELHDPSDYPMTIKTSTAPETLGRTTDPFGFVHGCCLCVSRGVLNSVGAFDTILGAGAPLRSAEDLDLVLRCFRKGFRVDYEPRVAVRHDHGRKSLRALTPLLDGYALGAGAVLWKSLCAGSFLPARAMARDLARSVRDIGKYRSWEYLRIAVLRKYGYTMIGFFLYPILLLRDIMLGRMRRH